jgi:hypothetical protein
MQQTVTRISAAHDAGRQHMTGDVKKMPHSIHLRNTLAE